MKTETEKNVINFTNLKMFDMPIVPIGKVTSETAYII